MSRVRIRQEGDRTIIFLRARPAGQLALLSVLLVPPLAGCWWIAVGWLTRDLRSTYTFPGHRTDELVMDGLAFLILFAATYFALRMGWRSLLSCEQVVCDPSTLTLRRGGFSRRYAFRYMHRLRATPEGRLSPEVSPRDPWSYAAGRNVAFHYGPQTVRFGLRLPEAEAGQVVDAIQSHAMVPDTVYSYETPASDTGLPRGVRKPPAPRARVEDDGWSLRISIPAKRDWPFAVICAAALAYIGTEATTIVPYVQQQALSSATAIVQLVVAALLFFGAAYRLMWSLFGAETVTVGAGDRVTIARDFGLFRRRYTFTAQYGAQFSALLQPGVPGPADLGLRKGNIAFLLWDRAGRCTGRFGVALEEAEAEALVRLLESRIATLQSGAF